jgi:WD repeat-containing protein 88
MKTFATASWDKTIQLWDITTGFYRSNGPTSLLNAHEGSISCCALNDNASLCVSGGYDLRLVLWDANYANAKLILRGHTDWITDTTISSDNKWIISVGKDKEIRCWDIENCDNIKQVEQQNKLLGNKIITVNLIE